MPWPESHKSLSFAGVELQVAELGRYLRVWGLALPNFGSAYGTTWGPWRPLSTAGVAQVVPWDFWDEILGWMAEDCMDVLPGYSGRVCANEVSQPALHSGRGTV